MPQRRLWFLPCRLRETEKVVVGNLLILNSIRLAQNTCSLPGTHPCALPCHAPAACSEAEPCRATVTLSCPCGRIRQSVPCGRSTSNPGGREGSQQLKCTSECLVAKRNARLAEALGIDVDARKSQVTYSDELIAFAKANLKFCQLVEKTFAEYA